MPWMVEGTAEAGVGSGMPGAAVLARAGICPPAEGAGTTRMLTVPQGRHELPAVR